FILRSESPLDQTPMSFKLLGGLAKQAHGLLERAAVEAMLEVGGSGVAMALRFSGGPAFRQVGKVRGKTAWRKFVRPPIGLSSLFRVGAARRDLPRRRRVRTPWSHPSPFEIAQVGGQTPRGENVRALACLHGLPRRGCRRLQRVPRQAVAYMSSILGDGQACQSEIRWRDYLALREASPRKEDRKPCKFPSSVRRGFGGGANSLRGRHPVLRGCNPLHLSGFHGVGGTG